MNSIHSLYIPAVSPDIDPDFIIDAFYCNDIASISRVTLLPHGLTFKAFIHIHQWHETEAAYAFISLLIHPFHSPLLSSWIIHINPFPLLTSLPIFAPFTTLNYLLLPLPSDSLFDFQFDHEPIC